MDRILERLHDPSPQQQASADPLVPVHGPTQHFFFLLDLFAVVGGMASQCCAQVT